MKKKTLKKMFRYINQELFDNMLDMPMLYLYNKKEMKKVYQFDFVFEGLCVPIGDHYLIGIKNDLTKQNTFDTMAHEMMHIALMDKNGYSKHGKPFKKMCEKGIDTFYYNML